MNYLLDTDTLIDYMQDRGQTRPKLVEMIEGGDTVALCAITVAEINSGLNWPTRIKWLEFLNALTYWDISRSAATQAGINRKAASETGRTFSVTDAIIAAVAQEHDATVLTSNIKDYPRIFSKVMSLREETAA